MKNTISDYSYWVKKNWYYHQYIARFYQFIIPQGMKVLHVGCKTGYILHAIKPALGIGVDRDPVCIEQAVINYPQHQFFSSLESIVSKGAFDYIIVSSIMEVEDIQILFEQLQQFCNNQTRIILDFYSPLWEPILWLLQKLGMRRATPLQNWVSKADVTNFLLLADFEPFTHGNQLLFPAYIPGLSRLINSYIGMLPLINRLSLVQWIIARPKQHQKNQALTVSVIVPCRNEKGNIEDAVIRCPRMGTSTELIFVEGHSRDGTFDEIKRVAAKYPEKHIRYCVQTGKGKGDAVRIGFDMAQGDVLMILDADLTAPPEELPKFFDALASGAGEFINGSRLVYGMEHKAMRFLNLIANYLFGIGFSWLLGQRIKDTLCGTKVVTKQNYMRIAHNRSFFGDFDPFGDFDLLFGAAKQNLKIIDMPVHYKARTYGETQIRRFYHGLLLIHMFWVALWKFKIR